MNPPRLTLEHFLYALAVLLALTLRLVNLGVSPLAEGEAELALPAYQISVGEQPDFGSQPGYTGLAGLTFALVPSSEFTARLWPALLGASLALIPFCYRRWLGRGAALVLAFGLALDPGLVAVSRQVGGPVLALVFTLLALGLALNNLSVWAGIAAGLALLSGPSLLPGVLGLILAVGASRVFFVTPSGTEEKNLPALPGLNSSELVSGLAAMLLTLLLVGTIFLRLPQGLSAWLAGMPVYLTGWGQFSGVPALRLLAALVIYQPLALVFGLLGALRGWLRGDRLTQALSFWFVFALLLAVIYPARQVGDLAWALLPVWALAALELNRALRWDFSQPVITIAQAALLFSLSALIWLNLAGMGQSAPEAPGYLTRLVLIAGVIALGGVTTALVGLGWSWQSARQGLLWAVCAALGVYFLAGMWWSTQVHSAGRVELWQPVPASSDSRLLVRTLDDLSKWKTGEPDAIDVSMAVDSPALRWMLRHQSRLTVLPEGEQLLAVGSPSIVITQQNVEEPGLAATYRGQDFVLRTYPGWSGPLPSNFPKWLVFRLAPQQQVQVILWARADLFPGGSVESESNLPQPDVPQLDLP